MAVEDELRGGVASEHKARMFADQVSAPVFLSRSSCLLSLMILFSAVSSFGLPSVCQYICFAMYCNVSMLVLHYLSVHLPDNYNYLHP